MAPAVEALEEAILNGKLKIIKNPVLTWNVSSAILDEDPAGNRKFNKDKATGRIDGLVALTQAMGVAIKADNGNQNFNDFISNPVISG